MEKIKIIAEIGINHNGDLDTAKQLIDVAVLAGCDFVKFQKRTIDLCYTKEFLNSYRDSPWGDTQRDQKEGLEFGYDEYTEIDQYCWQKGIQWFASAWDIEAQRFLRKFYTPFNKIPSAKLTDTSLLEEMAQSQWYTLISIGMSTEEEIDAAVKVFEHYGCPYELMVCTSTYPMRDADANLARIYSLQKKYGSKKYWWFKGVGYSGHETGLQIGVAAAALGAISIEKHITMNRAMYGSDQAASIEPTGLIRLCRDIRIIESAMGTGRFELAPGEEEIRKKLRG